MAGCGEIRNEPPGRATGGRHDVDLGGTSEAPLVVSADPVADPLIIGRKARVMAVIRNLPLLPADGGNNPDAATLALGAEGDAAAVGREIWLVIVGFVSGQTPCFAAVQLLHPEIE